MRGRLIALAAVLVLAVPGLLLAKGFDLYSLFPNLTLGSDPLGVDSVYCVCVGQTATTLTMAVHVVTDNSDPFDAIAGIEIELLATADQAGVIFDETPATVFAGSAVSGWGIQSVDTPNGPPGVFPLDIKLGAAELDTADAGVPLPAGDHLFATLRFNISSPTNFTVCGKTIQNGKESQVATPLKAPCRSRG
jgi:hypothetical protein